MRLILSNSNSSLSSVSSLSSITFPEARKYKAPAPLASLSFFDGWLKPFASSSNTPCEWDIIEKQGFSIDRAEGNCYIGRRKRETTRLVVKYASKRTGEADILRRLSSRALREDPRNCTVPIVDILSAGSLDRENCLIVMKKGRDRWYEPEVMQDTDWRPFFGQISEGIAFMHERGIAHCGIHLDNIVKMKTDYPWVFIGFGSAVYLPDVVLGRDNSVIHKIRHTSRFNAPECSYSGPIDPFSFDVWCWGTAMLQVITECNIHWPELRALCKQMVVRDPLDRLTAQQVVEALIEVHDSAPSTLAAAEPGAHGELGEVDEEEEEDTIRRREHRGKRSVSGRSERTARTTKTTKTSKTEQSRRSERDGDRDKERERSDRHHSHSHRHRDRERERDRHHDQDRDHDHDRERDRRRRAQKDLERSLEQEEMRREKEEMHKANADRKRKSAEKVGNWQSERLSRVDTASTTVLEVPEEEDGELDRDLGRSSLPRSRKAGRSDPTESKSERPYKGDELKIDTGAGVGVSSSSEKPKKPKSEAEAEVEVEDASKPEKSEKGDGKSKRKDRGKARDDDITEKPVEIKSEDQPNQSLDSSGKPSAKAEPVVNSGDIEEEVRPSTTTEKPDSKQKSKSKIPRRSKP